MINELKQLIASFIYSFNNVTLNLTILVTVAVLFLILHNLRHLPIIKNISVYISFFPVLVHEMGHAFIAQILGGHVQDIHMVLSAKKQQQTGKQGYAITGSNSRFSSICVALAGYIAAPLMFFLGCYLIKMDLSFVFVLINIYIAFFYLIHTKQKWIPIIIIFVLLYVGYNIFTESSDYLITSVNIIYNILLGLLLGEILQSIIITTKTLFSKGNSEWDGSALKQLTHIPEFVWWLIWTFISIFSVYQSFILFNN
ncbi:M50 family metallopeptidase [Staphylococcus cohnii]|uniref:M50 family metallopeptidase n=2 Tax=Staphylococcus cohnii TaxID=29382 RepID=UPI003AF946B8